MNSLAARARILALALFAFPVSHAFSAVPKAAPRLPALPLWSSHAVSFARQPGWALPSAQAQAMREFGLQQIEHETLEAGGKQLQVTAFYFGDVFGSYGAFTYYRPANFSVLNLAQPREQAAAGGAEALFTRGRWLVRVETPLPATEYQKTLRRLAAAMTPVAGHGLLPALVYQLPRRDLEINSIHYAEGPAGFEPGCAWLPSSLVGFNLGAETITAGYRSPQGTAQLAIISYPTPQMARTYLARLQKVTGVEVRRTGSLLVAVHGDAAAQAQVLLHAIHFTPDISLTPPVPVGIDALPSLILSIFTLCAILFAVAVVLGVLTGSARAVLQRVLPERYRKLPPESIIQLHLQ